MLYAKVFPAQAQIECEAGLDLPGILHIHSAVVVTVIAIERRRSNWQLQRALGSDNGGSARVLNARIFALRINRTLILIDVPCDQVVESTAEILPQELNGVFIRSEHAVVANLDVLSTEFELVLANRPRHIIVELIQVLRTAERNGVARSCFAVAGEKKGTPPTDGSELAE